MHFAQNGGMSGVSGRLNEERLIGAASSSSSLPDQKIVLWLVVVGGVLYAIATTNVEDKRR